MTRYVLASFWSRLSAFLVDVIVLSIPMNILKMKLPGYAPYINFIISALYFIIPVYLWGKTLGKMFFKIKIVRTDLKKPGLKDAILRFLGTIISQTLIFIGYIMMVWDKNRQTLHDKIARTYVIIDM
jgi:uncharacterized RDD family membrane protein YckC